MTNKMVHEDMRLFILTKGNYVAVSSCRCLVLRPGDIRAGLRPSASSSVGAHLAESRHTLLGHFQCSADHSFKLIRRLTSAQLPQAQVQSDDQISQLMHL